jgi:hypothetical protein
MESGLGRDNKLLQEVIDNMIPPKEESKEKCEWDIMKYYTPTIDEFHVGFEYYYSSAYQEGVSTTEITINGVEGYEPMVFNFDIWNYVRNKGESWKDIFESILFHNQIKVKYLDKEDIKSLGWSVDPETGDFTKGNDDYSVVLSFDEKDHSLCVWNGLDWDDQHIWFDGFIKNKSELVKLLGQLDIKWE